MASNADLVRGAYAAFGTGDIPAVLALLAADARWTEAAGFPYGGTYVGPDAVLHGVFMRIAQDWDDFAVAPSQYVSEGDTVVAMGEYSGRNKATGRSFVAPFVHVWTFRDGKAVHFVQHVDTVLVQRAMA
jgi:ketosteroid isomerase-like protein